MKSSSTESPGEPKTVPALGHAFLTPLYDAVMAVTMRERAFRAALLEQAAIGPDQYVLDLGCGTGTLAVMIGARRGGAHVTGLDADPEVISIAERKALAAGVTIRFDRGLSTRLPYPDGSFDRVVSSLLFHHLPAKDKATTAAEARRVLRSGGEFHVVDWGRPANLLMGSLFVLVRLLDGFPNTRENVEGKLPSLFREAGFGEVLQTGSMSTLFGTLVFYRAFGATGSPATPSRENRELGDKGGRPS